MALCSSHGGCFALGGAPAPPAARHAPALRSSRPHAPAAAAGSPLAPTACALAAAGAVSVAWSRRRATAKRPEATTAVRAFENELGVQPPTGFWDPAGYTADGDAKEFYRRRCVEIKHGRVSMLACIGYIVPEYFKWPGYISPSDGIKFADIPHGLAAITRVPAVGWTQVVFFGLSMELFAAYQDPEKTPGKLSSRLVIGLTEIKNKSLAGGVNNQGYEFGPFGIPGAPSIADPELRKRKLNAELANGRLAMVAIMGMMFQNGTVGTTGPEMWLGASAMPKALKGTGGPLPDDE